MPANLTPEYKDAEEKLRLAKSAEEKLHALELMLATIPKHKGTDKMQADIKRRISKLREREAARKQSKTGKRSDPYHIPREGAAQLALVGPPNSGKSTLVTTLTNAVCEAAPYPFTTRKPAPGMLAFENIQFQLIDLPPISDPLMEPWLPRVVRNATSALLLINLESDDLLEETETVLCKLEESKVRLVGWQQWERHETPVAWRKCLAVGTKLDTPAAQDNAQIFEEFFAERFPLVCVSAHTGRNLEEMKRSIFRMHSIIRVYTRTRGRQADRSSPFILCEGATVVDLAEKIHKDILAQFKYACVWGSSEFAGQRVQRDHVLQDGDVVEIHAT